VIVTDRLSRIMERVCSVFSSVMLMAKCVIILHHCDLCDCFWRWISICANFSVVKHCFHTVLTVCDRFLLLYTFSPQKSYHCTLPFFGACEKQGILVDSATATLQLASLGWKYFFIMLGGYSSEPTCKISSTINTESYKINYCESILAHVCINKFVCDFLYFRFFN
jgi:hypothetical protein